MRVSKMWLLFVLVTATGTSSVYGEKSLFRKVTYPLTGKEQESQHTLQQQHRQQKEQHVSPALQVLHSVAPCNNDGTCTENDCAEKNLVALSSRCRFTIREGTRNGRCVDPTGYKRCLKDVLKENKCVQKTPVTLVVRALNKLRREASNIPALCLPGVNDGPSEERDNFLLSEDLRKMYIGTQTSQTPSVSSIYYGNPRLFVYPQLLLQPGSPQKLRGLDLILIGYSIIFGLSRPEKIIKEQQQLVNTLPRVSTEQHSGGLLAKGATNRSPMVINSAQGTLDSDEAETMQTFQMGHIVETSATPRPPTQKLKSGVTNDGNGKWHADSKKRLYSVYRGIKKFKLPNAVLINEPSEAQATVEKTGEVVALGEVKGRPTLTQVQQQLSKTGKQQHKIRIETETLNKFVKQATSSPMLRILVGNKPSGGKSTHTKKAGRENIRHEIQFVKGADLTDTVFQKTNAQKKAGSADDTTTLHKKIATFKNQGDDPASVQIVYETNPTLQPVDERSLKVETRGIEVVRSDGQSDRASMDVKNEAETSLKLETSAVQHAGRYQIASASMPVQQEGIQQKPLTQLRKARHHSESRAEDSISKVAAKDAGSFS